MLFENCGKESIMISKFEDVSGCSQLFEILIKTYLSKFFSKVSPHPKLQNYSAYQWL